MKKTQHQLALLKSCLIFTLLCCSAVQLKAAETHTLRQRGKTLIEAENYSAAHDEYPRQETCRKCSGLKNLGYFWKDSWFEVKVYAPRRCYYSVSFRAASEKGTSIELQTIGGRKKTPVKLGVIDIPKTLLWTNYTDTESVSFSLPPGKQTLRFKSLVDGANIDYITFEARSQNGLVSTQPAKNAGPEKNPLKGFSSGWWRPDDDYATVGFQYIEWGQLEPQDDKFDWEYLEGVLDREGTRGRHLILQFVVDWDTNEPVDKNYLGPDWLLKRVGEHRGTADKNDPNSRQMRATKYNHPVFVEESKEAIKALTDYFKDDPRIFVLQTGLLGFWAEWHTFPREDWNPNPKTKSAILDAYLSNLPRDVFTQVRYPDDPVNRPQRGIGYTNGSATPTKHGYEFGVAIEKRQLWKNGPVSGEWPPNVELPFWKRFFATEEGERFIKQARYSTLLVPENKEIVEKLPNWKPEDRFNSMHRQLGYNLQVDEVRHIFPEGGSRQGHFEVDLGNVGIAPFYRNWDVQLAILDSKTSEPVETIQVATKLQSLGPGQAITLKGISTQKLNPRREYQLGIRISQPEADKPKQTRWRLDARNVYVVLANDIQVIDGQWNDENLLQGGWNILDRIEHQAPNSTLSMEDDFFPFEGSAGQSNAR